MSRSIITHPQVTGEIETLGPRVVQASGDLKWAHDRSLAGIWLAAKQRGYDIQEFIISQIA